MSKTPVSILQEMMVKQNMIPDYELIHDGGGRHVNTFTYRVMCDGFTAIGTGRCKKEAKHEAATAMLTEIAKQRNYPQLPAASTPTGSPSRSPFHVTPLPPKIPANAPFVNAIGELQDLCAENNLQEPIYNLIKDSGPPHARVFTITCTVSSFVEEGVAPTKKMAKHDAAGKMVKRIKALVDQLNSIEDEEGSLDSTLATNKTEIMNRNAKERYYSLNKSIKKMNLGIKLSEYHTKWKDSLEMDKRKKALEELHSYLNEILSLDEEDADKFTIIINKKLSKLETILSDINVTVNTKEIPADKSYFLKIIELNTCPHLSQIGIGKTEQEADWNALTKMVEFLILLLS
ncbi:RISC-loading complex subunit TARBP2-like [Nylanderia fulva]|uniref:RISC-loading complex subunit TARBP2-like n=1 Tax=Nylanderia fulva TaxID=613905 RepID=UPI0010FAD103|nr:RISC-loading complex subunit TARBP2-like [Nylanderia fulva]